MTGVRQGHDHREGLGFPRLGEDRDPTPSRPGSVLSSKGDAGDRPVRPEATQAGSM